MFPGAEEDGEMGGDVDIDGLDMLVLAETGLESFVIGLKFEPLRARGLSWRIEVRPGSIIQEERGRWTRKSIMRYVTIVFRGVHQV